MLAAVPQQGRPTARMRGPQKDADVLRDVAAGWHGVPHVPIVVMNRGRCLGWAIGAADGRGVHVIPAAHATPFNTYDDFVSYLTKSSTINRAQTVIVKPSDSPVAQGWYDYWPTRGVPDVGDYSGTARTARQFTDATAGAIQHGGNVSPSEKYLTRFSMFGTAGPRGFYLYDRVITYDKCTFTAGSQAMTNTLAAQRYIGTGQPGLQMCLTADAVGNATAANLTVLTYVDNDGNLGQTMPTSPTVGKIVSPAAPTATLGARVIAPAYSGTTGLFRPLLPLAAGDLGVRSVTDYTWSAAPTGTFSLVLMFPIAYIAENPGGFSSDIEYAMGVNKYACRIYDGACLSFFGPNGVATDSINYGWLEAAWLP